MTFPLQPALSGDLIELRPLQEEDFDALHAVASDPLIWEQHPARDRWRKEVFTAFFREAMESHGAFAAIDRMTGQIIGSSRYHGYNPETSEVEIGWTFLARKYWGGAYNAEMKRLMIDHAFRFVQSVIFVIGPENVRSRRAVEKIGGTYEKTIQTKEGEERVVYRLKRPGS